MKDISVNIIPITLNSRRTKCECERVNAIGKKSHLIVLNSNLNKTRNENAPNKPIAAKMNLDLYYINVFFCGHRNTKFNYNQLKTSVFLLNIQI